MRRALGSLVEWFPSWARPLLLAASFALGWPSGVRVSSSGLTIDPPALSWAQVQVWTRAEVQEVGTFERPAEWMLVTPEPYFFSSGSRLTVSGACAVGYLLERPEGVQFTLITWGGPGDFDGDGDVGTDQDIEAFFACLADSCPSADFDGDGDAGTDRDIDCFFRTLGGGSC